MRWDAVLHPVGPLPESTYWSRRAVVLGGPLVLLVLIVALVPGGGSGPKGGTPAAAPLASASQAAPTMPSTTTSPPPPAAASTVNDCPDAVLRLGLATSATSYPAGSSPVLTVSITNTSTVACERDLGAKQRVITITSGTDRIWSSADCGGAASDLRTLLPKQTVTLTNTWNRRRTHPGCPTPETAGALAQTGVYVAVAKLGDLGPTPGAVFRIS